MTTKFGYAQRQAAARRLAPGLASRSIATAREVARRGRERRLAAITGAICIVIVVAVHMAVTAATSRDNLRQWTATTSEIVALEETP